MSQKYVGVTVSGVDKEISLATPLGQTRHIQVALEGAFPSLVEYTVSGHSSPKTASAALQDDTVIIDMTDVETITINSTGGVVAYVVSTYNNS